MTARAKLPTMIPVPDIPGALEQSRILNENLRKLRDTLERAIAAGDLVGLASITEAMLTDGAKLLAGPDVTGQVGASGSTALSTNAKTLLGDVTGSTGAAGATTVEKIRNKNVPNPGAPEDTMVLSYNHGTGAFEWVATAGGSGDGRVDRNPVGDFTLSDGESLVAVDYFSVDGLLDLQGDSVLAIL